ncbi:hypothetical protein [Krasilnikovia sp. MM14-A1259]
MTRLQRRRNDSGLHYSREIDNGCRAVPVPEYVQLVPLGRRHQNRAATA